MSKTHCKVSKYHMYEYPNFFRSWSSIWQRLQGQPCLFVVWENFPFFSFLSFLKIKFWDPLLLFPNCSFLCGNQVHCKLWCFCFYCVFHTNTFLPYFWYDDKMCMCSVVLTTTLNWQLRKCEDKHWPKTIKDMGVPLRLKCVPKPYNILIHFFS